MLPTDRAFLANANGDTLSITLRRADIPTISWISRSKNKKSIRVIVSNEDELRISRNTYKCQESSNQNYKYCSLPFPSCWTWYELPMNIYRIETSGMEHTSCCSTREDYLEQSDSHVCLPRRWRSNEPLEQLPIAYTVRRDRYVVVFCCRCVCFANGSSADMSAVVIVDPLGPVGVGHIPKKYCNNRRHTLKLCDDCNLAASQCRKRLDWGHGRNSDLYPIL